MNRVLPRVVYQLQEELRSEISDKMLKARSTLLENFDESVSEKLKIHLAETLTNLNLFEKRLWELTKYDLKGHATFDENTHSFFGENGETYCMIVPKEGERKSDVQIPDHAQIPAEIAERMFSLHAKEGHRAQISSEMADVLEQDIRKQKEAAKDENYKRNQHFFETEIEKLNLWADDVKIGLEREISDLDAEIKLRKSEARKLIRLEEKIEAQRTVKDLEKRRSEKRRSLFEAQDEVDAKKEKLFDEVEQTLFGQPISSERDGEYRIRITITGANCNIDKIKFICTVPAGVEEVEADAPAEENNAIYNLRGQKMEGTLKPGLYIKNGRKFVVK